MTQATPPLSLVEMLWMLALMFVMFLILNAICYRIKVTWKKHRRRMK